MTSGSPWGLEKNRDCFSCTAFCTPQHHSCLNDATCHSWAGFRDMKSINLSGKNESLAAEEFMSSMDIVNHELA